MEGKMESVKGATGIMVFSASKQADREMLGDRITRWMRANQIDLLDYSVTQSSDNSFHCLTITLFYRAKEDA